MFTQEWRQHWGLRTDPFACEDADKDFVLSEIDGAAVHAAFDRIYGDPRMPAPGIVFGEKGAGKSGLRLMMKRRLDEYNEAHPTERVLALEYIDFNPYLERFRGTSSRLPAEVLERWTVADHLDAMLSLATTHLVDGVLDHTDPPHSKLSFKQKTSLLLAAALYYDSRERTTAEAVSRLRSTLKLFDTRKLRRGVILVGVKLLAILIALVPFLVAEDVGSTFSWIGAGITLAAVSWSIHLLLGWLFLRRARKAVQAVAVLGRDPEPLAAVRRGLTSREREEYPLPRGSREDSRYELLQRLMGVAEIFDYKGWYVLVDRIDEPSMLSGDPKLMARFVEKLLDIKLLQYPNLALKLFLPIELESLHRSADAETLKSMRLDKSNLIPELKWGGRELLEIADKRLAACTEPGARAKSVLDFFEEGFDTDHLRSTLEVLGTPRYGFGFLSALVQAHVKELPGELTEDDPQWLITRTRFDIERAAWVDRTGVMRRTMN